jgi:hypothetical protein
LEGVEGIQCLVVEGFEGIQCLEGIQYLVIEGISSCFVTEKGIKGVV